MARAIRQRHSAGPFPRQILRRLIRLAEYPSSGADDCFLPSAAFVVPRSLMKPIIAPRNPRFSSGPCAKRPGWTLAALEDAILARSHRAKPAKAKLAEVIERSKRVLGIPSNYLLGIVPGSDTGAIEMALWSLLGERGVDVLAWEAFARDGQAN